MRLPFRFQKVIERLGWTGTIEVAYSAKPVEAPHYTDESPVGGGVRELTWRVVDIQRAANCEASLIGIAMAQAEAGTGTRFEDQVYHWCEKDFARRECAETENEVRCPLARAARAE